MLFRSSFLVIALLVAISGQAQEAAYAVFTSDEPPAFGLYRTADDYLNLRPSETDVTFKYIPRMEGESFYAFFRQGPDGKKGKPIVPKEYFAASDGKTFYIAHGDRWQKAKKCDSGYCFTSRTGPMGDDGSTLYTRNSMGAGGSTIMIPIGKSREYRFYYSVSQGKWVPEAGKQK